MKKFLYFIFIFLIGLKGFCAEDVFSSSPDSAVLNSYYGATVSQDGNVCSVVLYDDAKYAIIDWKKLNIPKNSYVKFYFADDSQYIINKVNTQTSQIFGIIASAPNSHKGTIIFTNPSGFVFNPASSVQTSGSALFTTHNLNDSNFSLTAQKASDRKYHGITILSGSKFLIKDNLTLASTGILINGGLLKSKDNIFVTAQSLSYSPEQESITSEKIKNIKPLNINDSIYFAQSGFGSFYPENENSFSIKNSTITSSDGQIIINSNNQNSNVNIKECFLEGDVFIKSLKDTNIISSAQKSNNQIPDKSKGAILGEIEINSGKNVLLSSSSQSSTMPLYKDILIDAKGEIVFKNVRIMDDVSQLASLIANDVYIGNYDNSSQDWSNSILGKLKVNAKNVTAIQSQILGNSNIKAIDGNIELLGVLLGQNNFVTAELNAENIIIKDSVNDYNKGYIARIRSNINARAQNLIHFANNSLDKKESPKATIEAKNIKAENFAFIDLYVENPQNIDFDLVDVAGDLDLNGMINEKNDKLTNISLTRFKIDGNLTINNVNKLKIETNKIYGSLFLNNIKEWYMGSTSIKENVIAQKIGEYIADEDNTFNDGVKYIYSGTNE